MGNMQTDRRDRGSAIDAAVTTPAGNEASKITASHRVKAGCQSETTNSIGPNPDARTENSIGPNPDARTENSICSNTKGQM